MLSYQDNFYDQLLSKKIGGELCDYQNHFVFQLKEIKKLRD